MMITTEKIEELKIKFDILKENKLFKEIFIDFYLNEYPAIIVLNSDVSRKEVQDELTSIRKFKELLDNLS